MKRLYCVLLVLALSVSASAQELHFGLKAGVPLTNSMEDMSLNSVVASPIRRYTVGITGEVDFRSGFGIQADLLYKRIGYDATFFCGLRCQPNIISLNPEINGVHLSDTIQVKGNSWEVPLQAKYSLKLPLRPYLASGLSLRHIGIASLRCLSTDQQFGAGVPGHTMTTTSEKPCASSLPTRWFPGFVISGGIEMRRNRLRLTPELRYTRWFKTDRWGDALLSPVQSPNFAANQLEILLGFSF